MSLDVIVIGQFWSIVATNTPPPASLLSSRKFLFSSSVSLPVHCSASPATLSQCDFVHNGRMTIYAKQTWGKNKNLTKVNFCWRQKLWPILNHLCPFWTQKKGVGKNKDIWYIMYHKQLLSQKISRAWKNSSIHDSVTFSKSGPSTAVTTEAGRSKPLHMQICGIERQPSCRCWIETAY